MQKLNFSDTTVLVIGDLILDQYYFGKVKRISPEAPVPVVHVGKTEYTLGGAANVGNNITHLGATAHLIGLAGNDHNRAILEGLLSDHNIKYSLIDTESPTINKIRVIGGQQQLLRLDFEDVRDISNQHLDDFKRTFDQLIDSVHAVILSDYGKGVCVPDLCTYVISRATGKGIPVIVDPKGDNWDKYQGASIITPNVMELGIIAGKDIANEDGPIEKFGMDILKKYQLGNLLVTRSEKGMSLLTSGMARHISTEAQEVRDVTGAGDTVVASLAVALGSGIDLLQSTTIANTAAGVVVSKLGTAPIKYNELKYKLSKIDNTKLVGLDQIVKIAEYVKSQNKKIVFTNGCFDILHRGHITYLRNARRLGDLLIIGLNTDQSVQRLKGPDRPYNNQADRAEILSCLEFVDYLVLFDEETPYNLIRAIAPDILVKGGDYTPDTVVGREFAGEVMILPFEDGYSSTRYINQLTKSS